MRTNIEEHKVWIDSVGMEMVPYVIVMQALREVAEDVEEYEIKLELATKRIENIINTIQEDFKKDD